MTFATSEESCVEACGSVSGGNSACWGTVDMMVGTLDLREKDGAGASVALESRDSSIVALFAFPAIASAPEPKLFGKGVTSGWACASGVMLS